MDEFLFVFFVVFFVFAFIFIALLVSSYHTKKEKDKINNDFPELRYMGIESLARKGILDILKAVEIESPERVENASEQLKEQLGEIIAKFSSRGEKIHYDNVNILSVALDEYDKGDVSTIANFKIIVQSRAYRTKNGNVVSGSPRIPVKSIFTLVLRYSPDRKTSLRFNCPNCGAPLTVDDKTHCPFCSTVLDRKDDALWQVESFQIGENLQQGSS